MGLDMYLRKKKTFHFYEPTYADIQFKPDKNKDELCSTRCDGADSITVTYESIYWRKASMIHRFFVDAVQDGEDDCDEYYVPIELLEELLETCKKVLEDHKLAEVLLPTKEGFFFGSTDYDESYFNKIRYTAEKLEEVIKDFKNELETTEDEDSNVSISIGMYYLSSW